MLNCNGQLMLTMLVEDLLEIPTLSIIQVNTDGITVRVKKIYEEEYYRICSNWMKLTQLELEFVDYSKMIIRDVNNYIAIYQDVTKKPKCKGFFEFENIPLHKNKSFSIIPYAIHKYFVNGRSVEETIHNHRNIFDFCAGVKASKSEKSGKSHYELHSIKGGELFKRKLSKTVRYYISTKGEYLFKVYENGSQEQVEAPKLVGKYKKEWKVTYFNNSFQLEDFKQYNIDYVYYISKAKEVIAELEDNLQLKLF